MPGAPARTQPRKWKIIAYGGAALVLVFLVLTSFLIYRYNQPYLPEPSRWVQLTNFSDSATSPALSADGRMLAFIRGPDTFNGPGQIYVKLLPDGRPVQLTHNPLLKMSPTFTPSGSSIAYTVGAKWETWEVPAMGGEPHRMLSNASGLSWIDNGHLLFSEIKVDGIWVLSWRPKIAPTRATFICPRMRLEWLTVPIILRIVVGCGRRNG